MKRILAILISLAAALPCCAQSADFNGTTSYAVHTSADVLASATTITVCVWINADGQGEGNLGRLVDIDEAEGNAAWLLYHSNTASVLRIWKYPGAVGTLGQWTVPVTDGQWNAVAVRHDFTADNAPTARVNFAAATVTEVVAGVGIQDVPANGYGVGNNSAGTRTWDGKVAYLQVFNSILSDADCDKALRSPGSVTSGLRLYVKFLSSTDVTDQSGNGFDATPTDLATGATGPGVYVPKKLFVYRSRR